ncbi:uncharacterized protein LOC127728843 [Mytilus californianus]|uniref:uncharacterized protein LOC127728843 n=1 Tax=Mytilus californianus TaxID=6549 RepID=UPI002246B0CE|nr:uncharacterized protein LOC127728843 [Mytilus californianus]
MAAPARRMNLFYWAPTDELWGHCSLALSDGTHISWWPMTEPGEGKKHPGLVPIALFTEWINAYQNQTLAKDTEYEGRQPAVLAIPVGLNEGAIKVWWQKFKQSQKYQAARLNCSTVVFLALKQGGALNVVQDPGNWWWDPDRTLQFARAMKHAMEVKKKGQVQFQQTSQAFTRQLQLARQAADQKAMAAHYAPMY